MDIAQRKRLPLMFAHRSSLSHRYVSSGPFIGLWVLSPAYAFHIPPSSPLIGLCLPYSAFQAFHQLMDSLAGLRLPSRLPTHSSAYAFHIPSSGPFIGSRFPVHGPYPEACESSHGDPAAWIWTCRRSRSGYKLQYILCLTVESLYH